MVNIAVLFGADRNLAKQELMDSLKFEMELTRISLSKEEQRNFTVLINNLYTLKEVQRMYPYIKWVEYINALLPPPLSVDENEVVVCYDAVLFQAFGTIVAKHTKAYHCELFDVAHYKIFIIVHWSHRTPRDAGDTTGEMHRYNHW